MKRVLSIEYFIVVFAIIVLLNLSLQAEDTVVKAQDNSIQAGDIFQPQDTVLQVRNAAGFIRVVDGDTIKVNYLGKTEFVRLIGIDAPENKLSRKAKSEAIASKENLVTIISIGIDAGKFIKNLLKKGDIVTIELDIETRDVHGELLGYIFLSDGKMLNEEIVRAGYANVINASPNVKYKERLLKAYAEAKIHKRGLWE
ncbi:MAG: thermonuclease family protein [Proteobacteria bacterium]|nr:thermonuclease family protein [Pseudomonadota bacterium]